MIVRIPQQLFSYTRQRDTVEGSGESVARVLAGLDREYPGLRFRVVDEQDGIREHVRIFVNGRLVRDIHAAVAPGDEVHILCAISGG